MKKLLLSLSVLCLVSAAFAQSDKYVKAMQPNVAALDTTRSIEGLTALGNTFERIATSEKTQWLPYYYAALANANLGLYTINEQAGGSDKAVKGDPLADKAEALLNKAEELSKDNSEIYIVRKMIANLRMMADPMNRYMKYGPIGTQALATAQRLNPENPRVYLLQAEDKYFTPEQFGGSKSEAKKLFDEAMQKFDTFKTESSLHPGWGRSTTQYFLNQLK